MPCPAANPLLTLYVFTNSEVLQTPSFWVFIEASIHVLSHSVMSNSLQPPEQQSARLLCLWNFPGRNTGVGCHFFLHGIFPIQGSNSGLLHCRWILYRLEAPGEGSLGDEKYYSLLLCCPVIIHQLINYRLCLRLLLSYILIFLGEILDDVLRFIILHYSIMSVKIIIILHGG